MVQSSNHLRYLNFDVQVRLTTDVSLARIEQEQ
jgi:hypothetical protein